MVLRLSLLLLSCIVSGRCQQRGGAEILFLSSTGKAVLASNPFQPLSQGQILAPEDRIQLHENAQIRLLFSEQKVVRKYRAPAMVDLQSEIARIRREQETPRPKRHIVNEAYSWLELFNHPLSEAHSAVQGRNAFSPTSAHTALKTYLTNPRLFLRGDGQPHQLSVTDPSSGAILVVLDVPAAADLVRLRIPEKPLRHGKTYPCRIDQREISAMLEIVPRSEATRVTGALKKLSDDAIDAREFNGLAAAYLHEQGFYMEAYQYTEKGLAIDPHNRRLRNLRADLLTALLSMALHPAALAGDPGHPQASAEKSLFFPAVSPSDSALCPLAGAMRAMILRELRGSSRIVVLEGAPGDASPAVVRHDGAQNEQEALRLADAVGANYLLLGAYQRTEPDTWIVRYTLLEMPSGATAGQWIGDRVTLADAASFSGQISRRISTCIDHELFLGALDRLNQFLDDFNLAFRGDKSECRIGEDFSLTVSATRTCLVWIYDIGTSGKSRLLHPLDREGGYRLLAGEALTLPDIMALPPAGWEELKAIATADSFSTARLEELLLDKWSMARPPVTSADDRSHVDPLPDNRWTAVGFKLLIKP